MFWQTKRACEVENKADSFRGGHWAVVQNTLCVGLQIIKYRWWKWSFQIKSTEIDIKASSWIFVIANNFSSFFWRGGGWNFETNKAKRQN